MKMKKMISANKKCTIMVMTMAGAFMGMAAAKIMIRKCSCGEKLKCSAKKAFRTMEDTFLN